MIYTHTNRPSNLKPTMAFHDIRYTILFRLKQKCSAYIMPQLSTLSMLYNIALLRSFLQYQFYNLDDLFIVSTLPSSCHRHSSLYAKKKRLRSTVFCCCCCCCCFPFFSFFYSCVCSMFAHKLHQSVTVSGFFLCFLFRFLLLFVHLFI